MTSAAQTVTRAVLDNGLTVIARENATAPVVAMTLLVAVGSRHETVDTNGVTALLGRALLKGTRKRSALEIVEAAEEAGGEIESATDQEYSEIRVRGLAPHWRALLTLLHEVMTVPTLAPDEVEREREALLAQIRGLEDQPFFVANRLLNGALYGRHALALPTSGSTLTVGHLRRDDLVAHFDRFYVPSRMTLAISGEIGAAEVLAEAGRLFGGGARAVAGPELDRPPWRRARARDRESRPTQQAQLLMGFLAAPVGHADHEALKVLSTVLGGGMSSRLFGALRERDGLAYSVGALYPTRRESGRIVVHVGTAPANVEAAEAGIRREIAQLSEEPVGAEELARAKAFLTGSFALDLRTNARDSFYRAFFELVGAGHGYVRRYPELIARVTDVDLQGAARRYLVDPAVVIVGPG